VLLPAEHGLARLRAASASDWEEFCAGRPEARAAIRERYHLDAADRLLSVFTVTGPAVAPGVQDQAGHMFGHVDTSTALVV
jgi:hypothetical protein